MKNDVIVNRELWRRYARGQLRKEELAEIISRTAASIADDIAAEKLYSTNRLFRIAICLYMHDKEGYGKIRLKRMIDELENVLESWEEGLLTVDDMAHTLLEETGFNVDVIPWEEAKNAKKQNDRP